LLENLYVLEKHLSLIRLVLQSDLTSLNAVTSPSVVREFNRTTNLKPEPYWGELIRILWNVPIRKTTMTDYQLIKIMLLCLVISAHTGMQRMARWNREMNEWTYRIGISIMGSTNLCYGWHIVKTINDIN